MRLGVISDTHGQIHRALDAVRMLESLDVDRLLHCGDIGTPEVVALLSAWPTHYVFGNCDYDTLVLEAAIAATGNAVCHGAFGELELDGVRIGLLHSHDARRFRSALSSGAYDLVCYGHTHVAAMDRHGDTMALNPGAIHRANPRSIAVVDLPGLEATIVPVG